MKRTSQDFCSKTKWSYKMNVWAVGGGRRGSCFVSTCGCTHTSSAFLSLTHTCTEGKTWQSDPITTQQIAVQPAVGLRGSCLSIRTTALNRLLCSFSGVLCLHMQATISVQQQLTWGNRGNNCLSFLVGCFDVW